MQVSLSLHLPREEATVPTARRLCRTTLSALEVSAEDADDILLALTEACTNVVQHATVGHVYDVSITLAGDRCTLQVTDGGVGGGGFDGSTADAADEAAELADLLPHGRGLALMSALMDTMSFTPVAAGTALELVKRLQLVPGSPLALLADD